MQQNFFQAIELFSQASKMSLQQLAKVAKLSSYKKNTLILNDSQSQKTFLYITRGWLKLFKESADGEDIIVDILGQRQHCGETFLFHPDKKETYWAQSVSNLEIFTLPLAALQTLIASDHRLALSFLNAILQKEKKLSAHIEHLSIQNAMQRIGCFLLRIQGDKQNQQSLKLALPYDKVLLATQLGMRPETFSRALSKLARQCDMGVEGEWINIPNLPKLARYVCQHCSQIFPCKLRH